MHVAGLVFDAEDVLFDASTWQRWLIKLLSRLGLHTHYQSFFRVWQEEYLCDVHQGNRQYWDAMRTFLMSAGLAKGQIDEVIAAGRKRYELLQTPTLPMPGARETIAKLNALGVTLGILSDSDSPAPVVLQRLKKLGFGSPFRIAVSSIDLGSCMPDPQNYQSVLSGMQLSPSEVAFIGHSRKELSGAAKLGMKTIAINFDKDVRADLYLQRFSDLLPHLTFHGQRMLAG